VDFNPEAIILHIGHNNLWYHPLHNIHPQNIKDFFPFVLSFLALLRGHHPSAKIIYSSIFPRSVGPHLDKSQRGSYNRLAARYGALTQSTCRREEIAFVLNRVLWSSVRKGIEHRQYFLYDGLHLNTLGKKAVAEGWVASIEGSQDKECTVDIQ
jgi:lysophospholipase L1-like esterase